MKEIVVKQGQNILDIALQYYGNQRGVWQIAEDNDRDIFRKLSPGEKLKIDQTKVVNPRIVKELENQTIATQ